MRADSVSSKQYIQDLESRLADMQNSLQRTAVSQTGASIGSTPLQAERANQPAESVNISVVESSSQPSKSITVSKSPDPIQQQIRAAVFPSKNADIFQVIRKRVKNLKEHIRFEKFQSQVFAPLNSAQPNEDYMGPIFDEVIAPYPLFEWASFEAKLNDPNSFADTAWRACVYVVLSLTTCFRAANTAFEHLHGGAWAYFKTAFGMLPELMVRGSDLDAVEAVTVMAMFAKTSPDTQTLSVLINSATHIYQMLHMRGGRPSASPDPIEARRRLRVSAALCALSQELSCRYGVPPSMGVENLEAGLTEVDGAETPMSKAFYKRAKLVIIHSEIYMRLYGSQRTRQTRQKLFEIVCELEIRLIQWRKDLWPAMDTDPDVSIFADLDKAMTIHIIDLYLADHNGIQLMQWTLRGFRTGTATGPPRVVLGDDQQGMAISRIRSAKSAKATLSLIVALDWVPFATLWSLLGYFVSAFVILFAVAVDQPAAPEANSHTSALEKFVVSLGLITREHSFDLKMILSFCAQLTRIARGAIEKSTEAPASSQTTQLAERAQTVLRLIDEAASPMSLMHNFMGNVKNKDYDIAATLAEELGIPWSPTQRYGPFVPESLMPESYAFDFENSMDPPICGSVLAGA
ncbi:hypothetical protein TruAng_001984 [Truncatella angustata]|nr:hypothetical protein TruAng_001984 [Truncatella angustata]